MPGPLGSVGSVFVDIEGNLDPFQQSLAQAVPAALAALPAAHRPAATPPAPARAAVRPAAVRVEAALSAAVVWLRQQQRLRVR